MPPRRFSALYWTATPALFFAAACPQVLDDDFDLAVAVAVIGGSGSSSSSEAGVGGVGGSQGGSAPGSAAGDAGDASDAGATPDGSAEGGTPPIGSLPDGGDATPEGGAPAPDPCQPGSLGPDGVTCYYVVLPASWSDARQACLDAGQRLVQIDSAEEDLFVASLSEASLWIGLSDTVMDGAFVWTDGSPTVYANWGPEQPDAYAGPDCVEKRQIVDEPWFDQPCDLTKRFVCEAPLP